MQPDELYLPMNQLTPDIRNDVKTFCQQGYKQYDEQNYTAALRLFYQAWVKLPKPQHDYEESGWALTAIGDTYFKLKKYKQAIEALRSALCCPNISDNPFVNLRLGQCLYESGQQYQGRVYLHRSYRAQGKVYFDQEDTKYLHAIDDLI